MGQKTTSFIDSTPLLDNPTLLKAQAQEDGYLFFKNFLDPSIILELRKQMLTILLAEGYLHHNHSLMDGIANLNHTKHNSDFVGSGVIRDIYLKIQKLELFHQFPHQKKLVALYQLLLESEVLVHPNPIGRIIVPTGEKLVPTPPHQDYVHVKGTKRVWTCWIPLGTVPKLLGSLSILHRSHKNDVYPVKPPRSGGMEAILSENDTHWLSGDFEMGDILTFNSLTIHQALENRTKDQIRLSIDCRYQPIQDPVTSETLLPHGEIAPWAQIYENWKNTEFQYYWEKWNLNKVPDRIVTDIIEPQIRISANF